MKKHLLIIVFALVGIFSIISFSEKNPKASNDTKYQLDSLKLKRYNTAKVQVSFKCRHSFDYVKLEYTYKDKKGKTKRR